MFLQDKIQERNATKRREFCFDKNEKEAIFYSRYFLFLYILVPSSLHDPVLLEAVLEIFSSLPSNQKKIVIDATLGLGWHASEICKRLSNSDIFLGIDRDKENLIRAKEYLDNINPSLPKYCIHASFSDIISVASEYSLTKANFILYDLGVSSVHYDEGDRGFSTRFDGPLDMRFDRTKGKTAEDIVMNTEVNDLVRIFTLYGEEKKSWFIANAIVKARKEYRIDTTGKLLSLIETSSFDPKSPIRVFQALRIAVNDEFSHIESSLKDALSLLDHGWLLAVITFHSLEDRLVKQLFAPYLDDVIDDTTGQIREKAKFRKYTKKPIIPTPEEIERNSRSRSAKMRVIQKI